jgi:hypothetical protein
MPTLTPSGVGFAQDPAVTPGLGYAFVLVVVVVVVRTGRPLPATAYVGVQLSVDHSLGRRRRARCGTRRGS